jgi:hypothetical protein
MPFLAPGDFPLKCVLIRRFAYHGGSESADILLGAPQRMNFRTLVFFGVPLGLLAVGAFAQNCRPGTLDWDINIQCSCDKDPLSDTCQLYKRNKSMYDGKGLQPAWNPVKPNVVPSVRNVAPSAVQQDRTPVSPTLLPAETPFWQALPAGTRIAIGMRPQWLSASPLFDQLLSLGGQATGQKMTVDAVKREMAGVETVIIATTRTGGAPLILARATDVVRTTKSERDPYRYVDPNTILVGNPNETNAAMRRLFSQDPVSAEATMAGRVAAWSAVWLVADPMALPGAGTQFPGVTKMTVGLSMHDGLTMEAWLDTPSPFVAKNLTARLQKNPNQAPLFGQVGGAIVEQRGNSVRVYARVTGNPNGSPGQESTGSPTSNPTPGLGQVKRSKVAEVQTGMDRESVEAVLGKPHSVMAIHGDEEIETLIYNLDDKATARVRTVNGKVVSVKFSTD